MKNIAKNVLEKERINVISTFKHFHPGARIDIEFNNEPPLRVKAKLVGFEEGSYLIIAVPNAAVRDYADIVREGNSCIIRSVVEGEAGQCIAFRSSIQQVAIRPKGLIFVDFPSQIESINLRSESRNPINLPVQMVHRHEGEANPSNDSKTELAGHIKDISTGGCRIEVHWQEGQKNIQPVPVFLQVSALGSDNKLVVKATIKNQHREDPLNVSLGMMFEPDDSLQQLLAQLGLQ